MKIFSGTWFVRIADKLEGPEAGAKGVVQPKTVLISTIKTLPDYLNHDVLHHRKYVVEKLSVKQIAKEISPSKTSVIDGLKRFKIPRRPIGNSSDCSSNPPYGKRYEKGKFIEHQVESRVIKSIIILKYLRSDT